MIRHVQIVDNKWESAHDVTSGPILPNGAAFWRLLDHTQRFVDRRRELKPETLLPLLIVNARFSQLSFGLFLNYKAFH